MKKLSKAQASHLLLLIQLDHRILHNMPMNNSKEKDEYYKQREIFVSKLKENWRKFEEVLDKLSSLEIISLLSLCSTYRPFEPWQILNHISMFDDKLKGIKQ